MRTPYYFFFMLEKKLDMFTFQYKGVYYWQLIRFILLKGITINKLKIAKKKPKKNVFSILLNTFKAVRKFDKSFSNASSVDIIRVRPCISLDKDGQLDDHQYDYCDISSVYNIMDLYALGEYVNLPECVKYGMAYAEMEVILKKIKKRIVGEGHIPDEQRKVLVEFLSQINREYNTSFSIDKVEREVQYLVSSHIAYKAYYKRLFIHLKPRIIMIYPHYDEHMFAAIAAAREAGIISIEFQHGRINSHEAYWYEDHKMIGKLLPDYFFVYGEWWKEQVNLPHFCKVVLVGNPYLERQIQLYPIKKNDCLTISVFSNPQNGKVLSELFYDIQDYCIDNNIRVLYKLHPNELTIWKKEYPLLSRINNISIIESGSVYDVLSKSDFAIGVNSTVFYEALAFYDIRILIYTIGDYEGMKPLIESGMAKGVMTSGDIIQEISSFKNTQNRHIVMDAVWKSGASENIKNSIKEILELHY